MAKLTSGSGGSTTTTSDSSSTSESSAVESLLSNPSAFIRREIVDFILGAVIGLTLDIGRLIGEVFTIITDAVELAGTAVLGAFVGPGQTIIQTIRWFNGTLAAETANILGVGAAPVVISLYVVEFALVLRALPAVLAAASDFAGSIPVIGGLVDGLLTFIQEFVEG